MHSPIPHPRDPPRLSEALDALPRVGKTEKPLDRLEALAAFIELKGMGSHLSERISAHTKGITDEAISEIEPVPGEAHTYALTETELTGIVSRAAITGAMEAAYSIGQAMMDVRALAAELGDAFTASGENVGGEDQRPVIGPRDDRP